MRRGAPPPPIRTDGSNTFASSSMRERMPAVIDAVIADAPAAQHDALRALRDDVLGDAPLGTLSLPAPDHASWDEALARRARAGETWLATDWLFAESLLYRRIVEACRWWETRRDPFAGPKRDELANAASWETLGALLEARERDVAAHLLAALWGNRIDLSYRAAASLGTDARAEDLLEDDRAAALARVEPGAELHVVADNAGSELAFDAALADALLTGGASRVVLHVKMHPTFVSDATVEDVWALLAAMRARGAATAALAARLEAAFDARRLVLAPDAYWNSPAMFEDLPPRLAGALAKAALIVSKGDANYRRFVNDAVWPDGTSFDGAAPPWPAPVLALRTLKSDALAGVAGGRRRALDAGEPRWRTSGRYGLAQAAGLR